MRDNPISGRSTVLPSGSLLEVHDCLALALDATEKPRGYSQSEREARSYMRAALRKTTAILAQEGR